MPKPFWQPRTTTPIAPPSTRPPLPLRTARPSAPTALWSLRCRRTATTTVSTTRPTATCAPTAPATTPSIPRPPAKTPTGPCGPAPAVWAASRWRCRTAKYNGTYSQWLEYTGQLQDLQHVQRHGLHHLPSIYPVTGVTVTGVNNPTVNFGTVEHCLCGPDYHRDLHRGCAPSAWGRHDRLAERRCADRYAGRGRHLYRYHPHRPW